MEEREVKIASTTVSPNERLLAFNEDLEVLPGTGRSKRVTITSDVQPVQQQNYAVRKESLSSST